MTAEPEQIRAFRDTWELGIHSYLTYLRDRLLLARELLTESGSVFVQIGDQNVHHVREIVDEVFGAGNFCGLITFRKTVGQTSELLAGVADYLLWYSKEREHLKFRRLLRERRPYEVENAYRLRETPDGELTSSNDKPGEPVQPVSPTSQTGSENARFGFDLGGKLYYPPGTRGWSTSLEGMKRLRMANRLAVIGGTLVYKRYLKDSDRVALSLLWDDTMQSTFATENVYVVQTYSKVIQRCVLMTTDPGDLVFDPTCGSGTTAYVAEHWGRRWITCDTSRVALTLAKQRLMTAVYDYYDLAHPDEGVGSGFVYKTVPHITLKSIANNEPPGQETLYDQPQVDRKRTRVSGPFTVEAVPAPAVKSLDSILGSVASGQDEQPGHETLTTDHFALSLARSGETLRQTEWRDELLRAGIRAKAGQHIRFARLEPLPGCRWLHADGETRPSAEGALTVRESGTAYMAQRIVVSFGPEHAPLEQRQVEHAWEEARTLVPRPKLLVFAAFQFDPEAAKDIDEMKPELTGMQFLKVHMNADLLTDDLKKKRASNESFWLIGQPDVRLQEIADGADKGKWRVKVEGFDYYNTRSGLLESGGAEKIAVWLLDTNYDGRSLYPRQVFFPMAGEKEGWARLTNSLQAEIDEDLIESYRGTVSLPFAPGPHKRIAVKIADDRGIESLKVLEVE